jgi:hypothetical protein
MPGMIDKPQIQPLSGDERVKAIQSVLAKLERQNFGRNVSTLLSTINKPNNERIKSIQSIMDRLDSENFGPNASIIASTINHPLKAVKKGAEWIDEQMRIAGSPYAPSYQQVEAATNLAGLAQLGSFPMAPKSAGGTLGSITAWHGSPHKFDEFDMSKIGTGEGAQAYGHGLYFAESPDVAKYYADTLINDTDLPRGANHAEDYILEKIKSYRDELGASPDKTAIYQWINSDGRLINDEYDNFNYREVIDSLDNVYNKLPQSNLYKTSLEWPDPAREAADPLGPQHFLDWDKPLSEQPEGVSSLINSAPLLQKNIDEIYLKYPSNANSDDLFSSDWFSSSVPSHEQLKIEDYQNKIAAINKFKKIFEESGGGLTGGNLIKRGEKSYSPDETSKTLNQIGIPGIRYLDGGSRGAGEGSYNYVVFDDKIPKIKERNGNPLSWLLPATALGYGMAGTRSPLNTPPGKASD